MKNVLLVVLVALIGILSGLAILSGINTAVITGMSPMAERMGDMVAIERDIQNKLRTGDHTNDPQIPLRLAAIENKLSQIEKRLSGGAAAPQPPSENLNKVYIIPVGDSVVVGKKDAPISIQEFTDLQCPFCGRFYPPVKEALKAYPDKVNLVLKHYPLGFHPNARPAAKVAFAAHEQGRYIEMIELLLNNGANVSEEKLKEYAKQLGINEKKLMEDLKNNEAQYEARIKADIALANQVDVRGTPTFFINGKKTMARDFNGFKTEIEKILAQPAAK